MKVPKNFLLVIALVLFSTIASLSGCAGGKTSIMSSTPPDWVVKGSGAFKDVGENVFYGVGAVTGVRNKPLSFTTADNRARAEIAKVFEAYSTSLMRDYAASTVGGGAITETSTTSEEQYIEQTVKTFSAATLSGVMIIDRWIDSSDDTVYALARLDVQGFKNSVEKIKELNAEVREHVKKNAERAFDKLAEEEEKRGF